MANPPSDVLVFLLGFLGALAPEIARLYAKRWKKQSAKFSWWYVVISGLYALVGGIIATILPAVNYLAAFYAGVTWPLSISTVLHHRGPFEIQACNSTDGKFPPRSLIDMMRDHADLLY